MNKVSVLVTGANGFIGRHVCRALLQNGYSLHAAVRRAGAAQSSGKYIEHVMGTIDKETDWNNTLPGIDCVIHLAARVHVMQDNAVDPLTRYREENTESTLNLAQQAAQHGIKRFIYISSIKVNGENTTSGRQFTPDDEPAPKDHYSLSKHEAEQRLQKLARDTGMEVVIIRPPLVYGPGVKGNFLNMLHWLNKGIPLPFGAIHNRRSLLSVDNLVDFIHTCVVHPAAANQVFLVSDGEDLSTTALLQHAATALGRSARLLPIPHAVLEGGLTLLGKQDLAQRLCGSLQVDISKSQRMLDWTPPQSVDEGLRKTARAFQAQSG